MSKLIDLTNQKFGKWTVLKRAPNRGKIVYWTCQCECGNIKDVRAQHLREGKSISCGCVQKEIAKQHLLEVNQNRIKDITNQRFGKLTAIKQTNKRDSNGAVIWLCQCDCGQMCEVSGTKLRQNRITHCGCETLRSTGEFIIEQLLKDNNIWYKTQATFDTCRFPDTHILARFDFELQNCLVEFDGELHFNNKQGGWNTLEKQQYTKKHDDYKNQWCKNNGIILIRIPYYHLKDLCLDDLNPNISNFIVK